MAKRIYDYIKANPGCTVCQITAAVGGNSLAVHQATYRLERKGGIMSKSLPAKKGTVGERTPAQVLHKWVT